MPGRPQETRELRDRLGLTCRVVADPGWSAHRALGLARGTLREVWLSPALWLRYARLLVRGKVPRLPQQDAYPLAGVAVLRRDGSVAWRYASARAADYAPVSEIVAAARRVVGDD